MLCTVPLTADVAALVAAVEAVAADTDNAAGADIVTAQRAAAVERSNVFLILCSFILLKFILLILIINLIMF